MRAHALSTAARVVLGVTLVAAPVAAQKVLILQDQDAAGTDLLVNALKPALTQVDKTAIPSYQYAGNGSYFNSYGYFDDFWQSRFVAQKAGKWTNFGQPQNNLYL